MREYHIPTPQKSNRPPKAIPDHAKKNQKTVKKSLNSALSSVSEDSSVFESPKDLLGLSLWSDPSEHNLSCELSENSTASLCDDASPGSESSASSVLTPLSSTITIDDHEQSVASINQSIIAKPEDVSLSCFEAEIAVKYLREAQRQLFNARTTDLRSKKLLDALINEIIKEFYDMSQEEERYKEVTQKRAYLAFISILLLVLATSVVVICFSSSRHTFTGPTPTRRGCRPGLARMDHHMT